MRQRLNSKALYLKNKLLYNNFFINYPLIISSPAGVILAGALSHQVGGIGIHQKIPLRNYLGIRINKNGKISYESFGTYNIFSGDFEKKSTPQELKDKIEFLQAAFNKQNNKNIGLEKGKIR